MAEGRRILQGVARDGILIDYGDFNKELADAKGLPTFDLAAERGRADISDLLVRIHERDWEEGNDYMLTSLVELKGENYPGKASSRWPNRKTCTTRPRSRRSSSGSARSNWRTRHKSAYDVAGASG